MSTPQGAFKPGVITGIPFPQPQPREYGMNEAGTWATVVWEGTDGKEIDILAASMQLNGYNFRVTESFGKKRLEVQLFWNNLTIEAPVDLWEYSDTGAQKDVLQAAVNTGITGTLSPANISVIRNALNGTFPSKAPADANGVQYLDATANSFADGNPTNALALYNLMKSGMTDYEIGTPILKHTQTVSAAFTIALSLLNVRKLFSTSTLLSVEPTAPYWAVLGLPTQAPPSFADGKQFVFAWKKNGPVIQQIAYRKIQIIQEYQYGLWPTAVFGAPL